MNGPSFKLWAPLPNLGGDFELERLVDDDDGLHITLTNDTGRKVSIDFRSALGYRLNGRAILAEQSATAPASSAHEGTFFTVRDSEWIATLPPDERERLTHFLLALPGEIIEVLSDEEPNVGWKNSLFGDAV